jgi:phage-related baseplate assembly protein
MNTAIELNRLPKPTVIEELDFEQIYKQLEQTFTAAVPEHELHISDPAIKLLEVAAYRELLLRQRINDATRSVMLAFAQGNDLDNLAALFGVQRAMNEEDERFRHRIPLSLEGYSMAGTKGAYEYHTMSFDDKIKDVFVTSDEPGRVSVYALVEHINNTDELKSALEEYLRSEEIRPLTDLVSVTLVVPSTHSVKANIFLNVGASEQEVKLFSALDAFEKAHKVFGCELPYSGLIDALHQPGVRKVKLLSPAEDIVPNKTEAIGISADLVFME